MTAVLWHHVQAAFESNKILRLLRQGIDQLGHRLRALPRPTHQFVARQRSVVDPARYIITAGRWRYLLAKQWSETKQGFAHSIQFWTPRAANSDSPCCHVSVNLLADSIGISRKCSERFSTR